VDDNACLPSPWFVTPTTWTNKRDTNRLNIVPHATAATLAPPRFTTYRDRSGSHRADRRHSVSTFYLPPRLYSLPVGGPALWTFNLHKSPGPAAPPTTLLPPLPTKFSRLWLYRLDFCLAVRTTSWLTDVDWFCTTPRGLHANDTTYHRLPVKHHLLQLLPHSFTVRTTFGSRSGLVIVVRWYY